MLLRCRYGDVTLPSAASRSLLLYREDAGLSRFHQFRASKSLLGAETMTCTTIMSAPINTTADI